MNLPISIALRLHSLVVVIVIVIVIIVVVIVVVIVFGNSLDHLCWKSIRNEILEYLCLTGRYC